MARLDRLGPVRELAQIAACIGRDFDPALLAAVSGMVEDDLRPALDQLRRAELVVARGVPPNERYSFRHALVRDAAYEVLLRSRRAQIHGAIAVQLEQSFPEIVSAPEILAHHLTEAGLREKSVAYWLAAGKNSSARSANVEAITHFRRGLDAVASFPEGSEKDRVELDLQYALGPCLIATQGLISAATQSTFTRARELCERLGGPPEHVNVLHWLAVLHAQRGELAEAAAMDETAIPIAEARQDRASLINPLRGSGLMHLMLGDLTKARDRSEQAVLTFDSFSEAERLATRAAGQDAGAATLAAISWTLWVLGYPDTAVAHIIASLARAESLAHPHTQAYAYYYASVLYALLGQTENAHQHANRCAALSEEHGFVQWRGPANLMLAICAHLLDRSLDRFEATVEEFDAYRRRGYAFGITALYALLADVLLQRDRLGQGHATLSAAFATVEQCCERFFEAELFRLKAKATAMDGSDAVPKTAYQLLKRAMLTARQQGARSFELRAACDLARLLQRDGKPGEARELLAPVYASFTEGFDTADLREARLLLDAYG